MIRCAIGGCRFFCDLDARRWDHLSTSLGPDHHRRSRASSCHRWWVSTPVKPSWPNIPVLLTGHCRYARSMKDEDVIRQIDDLAAEERQLHEKSAGGDALTDDERSRERDIDIHLDVLWDLLRQRRALRRAGRDPDDAVMRGASTVGDYRQ